MAASAIPAPASVSPLLAAQQARELRSMHAAAQQLLRSFEQRESMEAELRDMSMYELLDLKENKLKLARELEQVHLTTDLAAISPVLV